MGAEKLEPYQTGEGPYRIMTFDGGGIRGAFTTQLILRMVNMGLDIGKVRLFAGTSTGSVIAAALALGQSAEEVAQYYTKENCRYIFSKKRNPLGLNLLGPKYSRKPLETYLTGRHGDATFADLSDREVGLCTGSFKLESSRKHNWLTVFFHNLQEGWRDPHFDYRNLRVLDAVLASGAAPTYFPSYKIDVQEHVRGDSSCGKDEDACKCNVMGTYIDGGVVANNPGVAGLAVATSPRNRVKAELEDIRLLSIGNGMVPKEIKGAPPRGLFGWGKPLLEILSDAPSDVDNYYCMSILGKQGYRRIQQDLPKPVVLDSWQEVPYMAQLAADYPEDELQQIIEWFNAE